MMEKVPMIVAVDWLTPESLAAIGGAIGAGAMGGAWLTRRQTRREIVVRTEVALSQEAQSWLDRYRVDLDRALSELSETKEQLTAALNEISTLKAENQALRLEVATIKAQRAKEATERMISGS